MRLIFIVFSFILLGWSDPLVVDVPAPEYGIDDGVFQAEEGYPNQFPLKPITIALPPGAVLESISFSGVRTHIGYASIDPLPPDIPMGNRSACEKILQEFKALRSHKAGPQAFGALLCKGGLRKYSLVTVACHHFAYQPKSQEILCAPSIRVKMRVHMPAPGSSRAKFWKKLRQDSTFDEMAKDLIFNWDQAQAWYGLKSAKNAEGYLIIIPSSIKSSVDKLADYRRKQGYDVKIVTKEFINASTTGADLQEKIRNHLRGQMVDTRFALLVGNINDMPWRYLVPYNNDPDSPHNDPNISPIPSDLYFAELTDPDNLSWNSDNDNYYGEVYDSNNLPNGDDNPDYFADIHLGRIPISSASAVQYVCDKIIAFDRNTDTQYKTASLLAGAMYYFANENNSGGFRLDGADFCEELMDDQVINRMNSVYLYEKSGINPSIHPCTAPITQTNHINYWRKKGIMYECHHGNNFSYARKIWAWDDGDNIPENKEFQWPTSLDQNDVYLLDNNYPATTFLRSCLCGNPETTSLGALLLHHGSSAVISSSRIAWLSLKDMGGMPYHFYDRLLKNKKLTLGVIGPAYDMARCDFMLQAGFWVIAYHYNLFGDPATKQFGWRRIREYEIPPQKK